MSTVNLITLAEAERERIRLEEEYRFQVREGLQGKRPQSESSSRVWKFLNSSFGLWLLSAIFISGAGSLYAQYQNDRNERLKQIELKETEVRKTRELIERLDLEIAYRFSLTLSKLHSINSNLSLHHMPLSEDARTEVKHTIRIFLEKSSETFAPLFPEFATIGTLGLIAELRRHVPAQDKNRLNQVINSLSGFLGELDEEKLEVDNPTSAAKKLLASMHVARWDQGFYYTDCSSDEPFC